MAGMAFRRLTLAWIGLGLAAPALPRPALAQDHWGAVAAGSGDTMVQAIGLPNRAAARAAALRDCRGRCRYLVTFYRSCAAIATGTRAYGWAAGGSLHDSAAHALRFCGRRTDDCRLRVVACSGVD